MPLARLPLAFEIQSRTASTAKDARLVNGLKESRSDKTEVIKRPGMTLDAISGAVPSGQGQGLFSWNDYIIAGWNNTMYYISNGISTVLGSLVGSPLPLSFVTVTGDTKLAFHNGSNLYTVNQGTPPTFVGGVGLSGVVSSVSISNGGGFYGYPVTCTISNATPCVVTKAGHGLVTGQGIQFTTTGALPTGLVVGTTYQVSAIDANTFHVNTAAAGGGVGTAINTTSAGSGTHSLLASPTVTFSASGGVTATGTAQLFNHQVAGVILTVAGTAYTSTPTITFSAPPAGTQAVISDAFNGTVGGPSGYYVFGAYGGIPGPIINNAGAGYLTAPVVTFPATTYPGGWLATGYTTISSNTGSVSTFTVTNHGAYARTDAALYAPGSIYNTLSVSAPPNLTALGTVNMASTSVTGPFAPGIAYLNNRVYIMTSADAKVYSSHIDDPANWFSPSLAASSDPDGGVAITRHLNYLVIFGNWSTEFFYDNSGGQDPAIVSTLAVYQSGKLEIGCAHGYSVANAEQTVLWLGQGLTQGRAIYMLEGLSPVKISTRYVEKYLNADTLAPLSSGASGVRSYCMKIAGHSLYVLTLINSNLTLVYDLDEKEWYQWTSQTGDTGAVNSGTETYFKPTAFNGNIEYNAGIYLQGDLDGDLYQMSDQYYTDDNGELIYFRAVSPNADNGTNKRKFIPKIEVIGDKTIGTGYIRHSDDDYVTWSPYRSVDLSAQRPILYQNGAARRRAWEFFCSDPTPIRLEALEADIEIGETGG